jgi:hypothetical protein
MPTEVLVVFSKRYCKFLYIAMPGERFLCLCLLNHLKKSGNAQELETHLRVCGLLIDE